MKKQLVFIFLLVVYSAQIDHGTVVTHYDLDGNLISEEFQQPIEDEPIALDSMQSTDSISSSSIDSTSVEQNTQNDETLNSLDSMVDSMALESTEQNQAQAQYLETGFEIQPVINKSTEEEKSSEYQQYQQQEKQREEQLQQVIGEDNLDWSAGQESIPASQIAEKQEELTSVDEDSQLQPIVASSDQVIDIQNPIEEPLNIDSEIYNDQSINVIDNQSEKTEIQQNQENIISPAVEVSDTAEKQDTSSNEIQDANTNEIEKSIPDMPIQEKISTETQKESIQPPEVQVKSSVGEEKIAESQEQAVQAQEQETKVEKNQSETLEQIPKVTQDMIPQEEEQVSEIEAKKEEEILPSTEIEEDIKFDNEQSNQDNQIKEEQQPQQQQEQLPQQQSQEAKPESLQSQVGEQKPEQKIEKEEQQKDDPQIQEITQEFPLAKEEQPEQQIEKEETKSASQPQEQQAEVIKQANEIVQGKCIIIYSQCDYSGQALEACDSLSEIEKFKYEIKSLYIPQGYGLTIYENQNFNGKNHRYTSSQPCLQRAVSFIQLIGENVLFSKQNLRGNK